MGSIPTPATKFYDMSNTSICKLVCIKLLKVLAITLRSQVRFLSPAQVKINSKSFLKNRQKYGWDCGVATTAFLLDVKGEAMGRRTIIKMLGASKNRGTDLVEIVKFFKARPEFGPEKRRGSSFGWIRKELRLGRLVLVAYQNWQKPKHIGEPDWGHYGVIYEIVGQKVKLFDPGSKTGKVEFSYEEFEKRWYEDDLGIHYDKWAMSLAI